MLRSAIGVWFAAALLTGLAAGQVADELRLADEPSSAAPAKPVWQNPAVWIAVALAVIIVLVVLLIVK